jgi:MFS family permease
VRMEGLSVRRSGQLRGPLRRRAMRLAYLNAGLWSIGNGLISTTLIVYLALEHKASGLAISLILAAPEFAGLLRLAVPALMARFRRRKLLCIAAYAASAVVLCAVPLVAWPGLLSNQGATIAALVASWCIYHLLEYTGTITLWSWLGDLVPGRIRGRFCGHRERWLVNGGIAGIVFTIALTWLWGKVIPDAASWQPLAASAAVGAVFIVAAVFPLVLMPAVEMMPSAVPRTPWRTLVRAMIETPYRRLLAFSCFFAVVNGITGAAQNMYPQRVLKVSYAGMRTLTGMMRVGQSGIAPAMGRLTDAWGNRPVMILSELVVATGPLFVLLASPERWWWLIGAYVVWIAYAGLNVGLDNIKLKLAPADNNAPYLSAYYAISDLAYGISTVVGGIYFDQLLAKGRDAMSIYAGLFLAGWIGRTLSTVLLFRLPEPGALRLRDLPAQVAAWRTAAPPMTASAD